MGAVSGLSAMTMSPIEVTIVAVRPSPEALPAGATSDATGGAVTLGEAAPGQTGGEDEDGGHEEPHGAGSDDDHGLPVVLRSRSGGRCQRGLEVDGSPEQGLAEEDGSDAGIPDARQSGDVGDAAGEHEFCTGSRDEVRQLVEVGLRHRHD